ncbi:relaxase/mobilization nuclease domain-containing protein [Phaeobacter gallaeciensis]|uniref:relaxase/mobilization nuclease domain-containing protein n=1 Tax=Phaeobacter gallaeciensis TaxID=60890 RepID=UPI00237F5398|nr:relaxase/mobilization nuclease domain-containing protein [Phaeobacter gallaeciensis]MDE4063866.1 relaxase/mobilization nuclease domain-containing protein [Phaeobacter gallaeciensis]MDE4126883.1 relaxase/mobilization nuclease domain-containing protein [Phaeobacter gallaeciensis]MDE4131355.1 relaxase/mobilization nuclease domain-containing protein [Phaeobacter gallaeciensis]
MPKLKVFKFRTYRGVKFKELVLNLFEGDTEKLSAHRPVWSEVRNIPIKDARVVAGCMQATTSLSILVKRPVYHLCISWPEEAQLQKEEQINVADTLTSDLGLSEHQCLIVSHTGGARPHIHIVVNTVHPDTGRVWNSWRDVYQILESLQKIEDQVVLPSKNFHDSEQNL